MRGGRAPGAVGAARRRRPRSSTGSTASCSRAAPTSTLPTTARRPTHAPACPGRARRRRAGGPGAGAGAADARCWPCAGGCRCSTSASAARSCSTSRTPSGTPGTTRSRACSGAPPSRSTPIRGCGAALGPSIIGQCHHHQAIDRLADGLVVTGRAPDGTVEAVELAGQPFVVGVQWHPEQDDPRIFAALVAAREWRCREGGGAVKVSRCVNRFEGRTAVVTGGGSGIGRASVRRLAEEGARVVVADVDADAGAAAAKEVDGLFVRTDVTSEGDVEALFAAAVDAYGRVDVAFNNAGISPPEDDSILTTGLDAWRRVQEVNLTSVYLCCRAVLPHMRRQGRGAIVNTASFVAVMGAATSQISYTASKGGVLAMTRELGVQFAREGIRVNALCPGPVDTPLLQELFAADPERAQRRLVHIPMGRFARAEEIAATVAFLASDGGRDLLGPWRSGPSGCARAAAGPARGRPRTGRGGRPGQGGHSAFTLVPSRANWTPTPRSSPAHHPWTRCMRFLRGRRAHHGDRAMFDDHSVLAAHVQHGAAAQVHRGQVHLLDPRSESSARVGNPGVVERERRPRGRRCPRPRRTAPRRRSQPPSVRTNGRRPPSPRRAPAVASTSATTTRAPSSASRRTLRAPDACPPRDHGRAPGSLHLHSHCTSILVHLHSRSRHQRGEDPGVVLLGVPLHTDDERSSGQLHGLDGASGARPVTTRPSARAVDGLVVVALPMNRRAEGGAHPRSGASSAMAVRARRLRVVPGAADGRPGRAARACRRGRR